MQQDVTIDDSGTEVVGYEPFDPRGVEPLSPESGVTITADDSSGPDAEAGNPPGDEVDLPQFDERHHEDFEGLLFLGALRKTFRKFGHVFVIRSLMSEDIIEIGLLHKEYVGTLGEVKAYQIATVAACVESVDGQPLPENIFGDDDQAVLHYRFKYVAKWHPVLVDAIYTQQTLLEVTVNDVLDAMGKVHG